MSASGTKKTGDIERGPSERGFTLIEVLIAMMLGLVVLGAIYSSFYTQKKTYISQERMVDMEQNLRVALDFLTRDIKMAGRNVPQKEGLTMGDTLGITTATATSLTLRSLTSLTPAPNGTWDETPYTLDTTKTDIDGDATIILLRDGNPLAEHFVPVGSEYLDGSGVVQTVPDPFEYFDGNGAPISVADLNTVAGRGSIRKVKVNLVARTEKEDPEFGGGFDKNAAVPGRCRTESVAVDVVARNVGL